MNPYQGADGEGIGKWVGVAGGVGNAFWSGHGFSWGVSAQWIDPGDQDQI